MGDKPSAACFPRFGARQLKICPPSVAERLAGFRASCLEWRHTVNADIWWMSRRMQSFLLAGSNSFDSNRFYCHSVCGFLRKLFHPPEPGPAGAAEVLAQPPGNCNIA
ncbi:unnamed protein product [Protopolystoma xenopodis]|uniref:Uncharacterized protein n=1 Tax=Protopolystoma xenopodis TaxID=117903 RepID=A0A3S5AI52_9PLAT|nr:unnamed protein product [Protopolystoma xenopodis]